MRAIHAISTWPASTVAAGWLRHEDAPTSNGPTDHRFALASLTKPLFSYAVLVAVEEGSLSLDDPAGPTESTVRHLLAHASGLAPELATDDDPTVHDAPLARVGTRRIYSNYGFDLLGMALEESTGMSPATYLQEAVLQPLGMISTSLDGSPAKAAVSTVEDFLRFGQELLRPRLIAPQTLSEAISPQFPDLDGVLPAYGRQTPNPWGLGFEIKGEKSPHWTGAGNSPGTFGHFGRSGTFFWVDPEIDGFLVVLTDEPFGSWAQAAWPELSDAVLAELS